MDKHDEAQRRELEKIAARIGVNLPRIAPADQGDEPCKAMQQPGIAVMRESVPVRRNSGAKARNTGVVWDYPPVALPERKMPISKRYKQPVRKSAEHVLHGLPRWYEWAMQQHNVTPREFSYWRKYVVQLSVEECGALLRVSPRTINNWEQGRSPISFSVWYVMHCYLQKPEVWLSRDGFRDLYVDYRDGEAYLVSDEYPDIRFTHGELVYAGASIGMARRADEKNKALQARIRELEAENTGLRRMFKDGDITKELESMRARIAGLLQQLDTADIYSFPTTNNIEQQEGRKLGAAA